MVAGWNPAVVRAVATQADPHLHCHFRFFGADCLDYWACGGFDDEGKRVSLFCRVVDCLENPSLVMRCPIIDLSYIQRLWRIYTNAIYIIARHANLPLPTNHGGPYKGDLTYYDPALGSCGITSSSSDLICAVSHKLFDAASTGSNPNANPLCGLKLRVKRGESSVDVMVVDRCMLSLAVFCAYSSFLDGRCDLRVKC